MRPQAEQDIIHWRLCSQCIIEMIGIHVGRVLFPELEKNIAWTKTHYPGIGCIQIFTNNPRTGELLEMDVKRVQAENIRIYIHSSYVCTLWNKLPAWQLHVADQLGAAGVVFHLPAEPVDVIAARVDLLHAKTRILLEMRAMKPGPYSFETAGKICALAEALAARKISPARCGICIDTAHIFAGGTPIRTAAEAGAFLHALDECKDYIALLHLNGNQYDKNRDKHCAPGDKLDKIWGPDSKSDESDSKISGSPEILGYQTFVDYFLKQKKDIIMEQAMQDPSTLTFYGELRKR